MIVRLVSLPMMEPLGAERSVYAFEIAQTPLYEHLFMRLSQQLTGEDLSIIVQDEKLAQDAIILHRMARWGNVSVERPAAGLDSGQAIFFPGTDGNSLPLRYPWDLLAIAEDVLVCMEPGIAPDAIIEPGVEIRGNVRIESGVRVLAGARIKGNIYIGANTLIGNAALVRGNVSLGPDSIVGFSADLKSTLAMERTQMGPLSFVADSVLDTGCFLGGVVRTSNYRLDGRTVFVLIDGKPVDTERRQFGTILGAAVSLGVGCVILPGRKIGAHCLIDPQVNVVKNIPAGKRVLLKQSLSITDR